MLVFVNSLFGHQEHMEFASVRLTITIFLIIDNLFLQYISKTME